MEPQTSRGDIISNTAPEQQATPITPESLPNTPVTPETSPVISVEQAPSAEQLTTDQQGRTMVADPTAVATPTDQPTTQPTQATAPTSSPPAAADNDVIEKEWIAKAQQVISGARGDPHKQQKEVSKLMADYVLKRFGKKIGEVEE